MALMHRAGISGPEAGVAVRSISGSLLSPTKQALMAMNAAGIDFNKYTTMPGGLSAENLSAATKRQLGKEITAAQKEQIQALMNEPSFIASQEEFTRGIVGALGGA